MSYAGSIGRSVLVAGFMLAVAVRAACAADAATGTIANLQAAYNGESNAAARYTAFAAKADEEGYKKVGQLFRAVAKSEGVHVRNMAATLRKLGAEPQATLVKPEVKTTRENLEAAIKAEKQEVSTSYPAFARQAAEDKNADAVRNFKGAVAVESEHVKLFDDAATNLETWKQSGKGFLVCSVCGFTSADPKLRQCPVCAAPRTKINLVP